MTDRSGPTRAQSEVLRRLQAAPGETIVRYPGGFWILKSQLADHGRRAGAWYVPTTTITAMWRRLWLRRIDKDTYELTIAGKVAAAALPTPIDDSADDGLNGIRAMLPGRRR